jgi:hypothetical protein
VALLICASAREMLPPSWASTILAGPPGVGPRRRGGVGFRRRLEAARGRDLWKPAGGDDGGFRWGRD